MNATVNFTDNPAARENFITVQIDTAKALQSWRLSILSREWLTAEGKIKSPDQLSNEQRAKFETVQRAFKTGDNIIKPILGIGIMDNVEIGSGREIFAALVTQGLPDIPAHIPKSNLDEFTDFIAK